MSTETGRGDPAEPTAPEPDQGWRRLYALAGGVAAPSGPGQAVRLDGAHAGWLVDAGEADIFAVREPAAGTRFRRHFVARVPAGSLVPGGAGAGVWRLELVPLVGTRLAGLTPRVLTGSTDPALAGALDRTLAAIADAVRTEQGPRDAIALKPRQILSLAAGSSITGNSHVWWVRAVGGDLLRNGGTGGGADLVLLAGRDWVTAEAACTVESFGTADLLAAGQLWPAVAAQTDRLLRTVERQVESRAAEFEQALRDRKRINAGLVAGAARAALGVAGVPPTGVVAEPVHTFALYRHAAALLRLLVADEQVPVVEPSGGRRSPADAEEAVRAVARASALHLRDIALPPDWWRRDVGPLVGWHRSDAGDVTAAALVFRRGRYRRVDPDTRHGTPLDRRTAAGFGDTATQVQVPLPPDATPRRALRLGGTGGLPDSRRLLTAGTVAGVLGLAAPVTTGVSLGALAEQDSAAGLRVFALLLACVAGVAALAATAQNLRLLRLEGRIEQGIQLGMWDRLVRLPVRFFRSHSVGELANAVLGVSFLRQGLTGLLPQLISAALTMAADLVLLFAIDTGIGLAAVAMVALAGLLVGLFGPLLLLRQRRALPGEHRTAALTNQLLGGIAKIKLAGAEDRAYSRWADATIAARLDMNRVRHMQAVLTATGATLPIAGQLLFFGVLAGSAGDRIALRPFLIANAAFAVLLACLLIVVAGLAELFAAAPRLAVLGPLLAAEPERRPDRLDPGDLRGDLTVADVTFAYAAADQPVLQDVSLHVRPGEFVAVVGPSGCGKSTLLRLLLGFEQPAGGAVLYDDQDLAELDVHAVRRQCGVVLQDGMLFAGSLRENICGAGNFSLEQAWEAARMAGLDADIETFPMQMNTMVPDGGGTLSVGQRQRVLIARALIHRPRIVLFDEATSALDNRTQEIVTASTRQLAATRVVIAHRLSTVVGADRIVVLDAGRVVQEGTYGELMADGGGLFHRLARRQLLTRPPDA